MERCLFLAELGPLLWRRTAAGDVSWPAMLFTDSEKGILKWSRPQQVRWETLSPRFRASHGCLLLP